MESPLLNAPGASKRIKLLSRYHENRGEHEVANDEGLLIQSHTHSGKYDREWQIGDFTVAPASELGGVAAWRGHPGAIIIKCKAGDMIAITGWHLMAPGARENLFLDLALEVRWQGHYIESARAVTSERKMQSVMIG